MAHLLKWARQFRLMSALVRVTDGPAIVAPAQFRMCAMAVLMIGLIAVGLLGDGFMLYVLLKWLRE